MRVIPIVLAFLFMSGVAFAAPITAILTGGLVDVMFIEPDTNADGTPLTDLDHTTIYYDIGQGTVKALDIPATAATGGGMIAQQISVSVGDTTVATISIWATATDTFTNESDPSATVVVRHDILAPAPPQ